MTELRTSSIVALAAGCVVVVAGSAGLRGDECASYGPTIWLDGPQAELFYKTAEFEQHPDKIYEHPVPPNVRFRLFVDPTGCGGIDGGPAHVYRLAPSDGEPAAIDQHTDGGILELVPRAPLAPGVWELAVRYPISQTELGPFVIITRVRVADDADRSAPSIGGILHGESKAVLGSRPLTPCEAYAAWVIVTRIVFAAAVDPPRDADELLYFLDRRPAEGGPWERLSTFRPNEFSGAPRSLARRHGIDRAALREFEFETVEEWDQRFEYRLRVRDFAGNESLGDATVSVNNPSRPGPDPGLAALDVTPASSSPPPVDGATPSAHCAFAPVGSRTSLLRLLVWLLG